jgi:hypothetical protein
MELGGEGYLFQLTDRISRYTFCTVCSLVVDKVLRLLLAHVLNSLEKYFVLFYRLTSEPS